MIKREELCKKLDKVRSQKDKISDDMNESIKDFIINNCGISDDVKVRIELDFGYISEYTEHRLKDIEIRINLFANGEDTNVKVKFEDGKMYIRNNTIVGLSKEDEEDLVYINSYKILHYLLTEGYDKFKTFVISTVRQDIEELGKINTKINNAYEKVREFDRNLNK